MKNLYGQKPEPLWKAGRTKTPEHKKVIVGDLLFFTAFFSFCLKYTLDVTSIMPRPEMINSLLVAVSLVCSVTKICTQRYTLFRLVIILAACAVMGYSSLVSINYLFLMGFMLIISMQDIDLIKAVQVGLFTKTAIIFVHVLVYIIVYFTNKFAITFVYRGGAGTVPRHSFFMGHANTFSAFLIWTCLDYIFLNYKKLNILHMTVIWLINLIFYRFTYTNTGIMVLILTTALIAADKLGRGLFDKLLTLLAGYSYIFLSLLFTFVTVIYTFLDGNFKEIWDNIDNFMTGRLWFGAYSYDLFGFTFLGRNFDLYVPRKIFWYRRWFDYFIPFDNYYISNLYHYGIINLVVTALAFFLFSKRMENREKIMIIAFSFYGIMENYVSNVFICFALLIIGKYIYAKKAPLSEKKPE